MNKDNILFAIVGLLLGLIIGFIGANSINRNAISQANQGVNPLSGLPEGHPGVTGQADPSSMPEVQSAVEKAKQEPENFEAQVKAGELFYQIQRYDEAVNYFAQANKLKPDDRELIVRLGNASFDGSKFEEAEKWYLKALETDSEDVNVRTDLGLTFIFRVPPDYDRAIKEFLASLERNPTHPQTLQNLVVAYTKKGDAAKATETLAKLEAVDSQNQAIARLREEIQKMPK